MKVVVKRKDTTPVEPVVIQTEFIKLEAAMKLAHAVSGGMAKTIIQNGDVLVNGEVKATFTGSSAEIDLTEYLIDEDSGKITRGSWQSLEILPDDLAYIKVSLMVQGFVQSRGDAVV